MIFLHPVQVAFLGYVLGGGVVATPHTQLVEVPAGREVVISSPGVETFKVVALALISTVATAGTPVAIAYGMYLKSQAKFRDAQACEILAKLKENKNSLDQIHVLVNSGVELAARTAGEQLRKAVEQEKLRGESVAAAIAAEVGDENLNTMETYINRQNAVIALMERSVYDREALHKDLQASICNCDDMHRDLKAGLAEHAELRLQIEQLGHHVGELGDRVNRLVCPFSEGGAARCKTPDPDVLPGPKPAGPPVV